MATDTLLSLKALHKSHDGRPLIEDAELGVEVGDKVGIIGANGAGKSTLLRMIAGQDSADSGMVSIRRNTSVAFLEQVPRFPEGCTIEQALQESVSELRRCIAEYEVASAAMRDDAQQLLERIESLGGWDYQHRLDSAAAQLRLPDPATPISVLSGGERRRVSLAQAIIEDADLLLIDEPTNHLDATTVDWLEEWLCNTTATVLLVTHDRYFLDEVAQRLVELRDGKLRSYAGNYTDYLGARAVEEAHRERSQHRQLRVLMAELEWARRAPKARTTKAQARLDRVEDVADEVERLTGTAFVPDFQFGNPARLGKTILELHDVHAGYDPARPLIAGFNFEMCKGERIGIIGDNGCGKSTLLKLITGDVTPLKGKVTLGINTRVAYFDQNRTALLDGEQTVRQVVNPQGGDTVYPGGGEDGVHVISWLTRFGFQTLTHDRKVDTLSGGERNRLAIARFLLQDANLLIFDEPTNDLDIATLNILEGAIAQFQGCVLIVSHDRYLLDKVTTGIIAFEGDLVAAGTVTLVQGSYTNYVRTRLSGLKERHANALRDRASEERKAKRNLSASPEPSSPAKRLTYSERIELEGIEQLIEEADGRVVALEDELADPTIWSERHAHAQDLQAQLATSQEAATTLYERWESLLERQGEG